MTKDANYGFRIVGPLSSPRKIVDFDRAFNSYANADVPGGVEHEAYLSAFNYGPEFTSHFSAQGQSTRGYSGSCGSDWCWFDIDHEDDLPSAQQDARSLCGHLCHVFGIDEEGLLCFFSGAKGFHVGLPLAGFDPDPSPAFNLVSRRFAEQIATNARVQIDAKIYDKVRAFRAPNSRHPKTGLYKRRLSVKEVQQLSIKTICELAADPEAFDLPDHSTCRCAHELPAAWNEANAIVKAEIDAASKRRLAIATGEIAAHLNRSTIDFICDGAEEGERASRLFGAAANLAECGAPLSLCQQLLREAALDTGLAPAEVDRQIHCGFDHVKGGTT